MQKENEIAAHPEVRSSKAWIFPVLEDIRVDADPGTRNIKELLHQKLNWFRQKLGTVV